MTEKEKQNMIHRSMSYGGVRFVHFLSIDKASAKLHNTELNIFQNDAKLNRYTVDRYTKEIHLNWMPESARERRLREFVAWEGKQ